MPQAVDTDYRRRSIGMPITAPLHPLKAGRSSMAAAGQAYTASPASALQYLADKGSKVKELETEVSQAHSEIISINQQLQYAKNSLRASANSLAIVQSEKDFLQAQRDSEREEMEVQIQKAEQRIAALSQDLRHADAAKVKRALRWHSQDFKQWSTRLQRLHKSAISCRQRLLRMLKHL